MYIHTNKSRSSGYWGAFHILPTLPTFWLTYERIVYMYITFQWEKSIYIRYYIIFYKYDLTNLIFSFFCWIIAKFLYINIHALSISPVRRESSNVSDLVKSAYEIVRKPKMKIQLTNWLVPHESAQVSTKIVLRVRFPLGLDRIYLIATKIYICIYMHIYRETISNVRDWTWPISTAGESSNRIAKSL